MIFNSFLFKKVKWAEEIEFSKQKSSIPWSMATLVFTSFLFAVSNFGAETGVKGIDI